MAQTDQSAFEASGGLRCTPAHMFPLGNEMLMCNAKIADVPEVSCAL